MTGRKLFIAYAMLICAGAQGRHINMTLQTALEKRLVHAKASGTGGHMGYCVSIELMNLTKDSVLVVVEAGRRLNSADDHEQDIMIVKEERMLMKAMETKAVRVRGFCCQATNRSPGNRSAFKFSFPPDSNYTKLGKFIEGMDVPDGVVQQAVWSMSEGHSVASVTALKDSTARELREFLAALKGERLPWYTVVTDGHVYPSGEISRFPVLLRGRLKVMCAKEEYVTLKMYDDKGRPVCRMVSEWKKAGENVCNVEMPVKGLEHGKYRVEMTGQSGVLLTEEVEL
jgi:hypothetical protein